MTPEQLSRFFDDLDGWARARAIPTATLSYGEHDDQVLDLHGSDAADGRPLLFVLHGGFWRAAFTRRNTRRDSIS